MWYFSPSWVFNLFLRLSVGLSLIILGIAFYRNFPPFYANATDGLGALKFLGTLWSYALPGLFILAGGLLVVGRYAFVTAWVGGIAIGSVPVGMALKVLMTEYPIEDALTFMFPMFVWMIAFHLAVNMPTLQNSDEGEDD